MPSSFGPIVTPWTVEQAVRDTLQTWIDTFLNEVERQSGGRWNNARQIQRPRSWFITSAFHDIPEQKLPAVHVESARVAREHADGGKIDGTYPMAVQVVLKAQDRAKARELLGAFEWAVSAILEKHGDLGGSAAGVFVGDTNLDLVPPDRDRTLVGFELELNVTWEHIQNRFGGPGTPDEPDVPPPVTSPEDPEHLTTTITINGSYSTSSAPVTIHPSIPPVGTFRESVATYNDLPDGDNQDGDVRLVREDSTPYVWDTNLWSPIAGDSSAGQVLVWDPTSEQYVPANRREFIGPVDPTTLGIQVLPADRWTPTVEPTE